MVKQFRSGEISKAEAILEIKANLQLLTRIQQSQNLRSSSFLPHPTPRTPGGGHSEDSESEDAEERLKKRHRPSVNEDLFP